MQRLEWILKLFYCFNSIYQPAVWLLSRCIYFPNSYTIIGIILIFFTASILSINQLYDCYPDVYLFPYYTIIRMHFEAHTYQSDACLMVTRL